MTASSWREMARLLAHRLENHALAAGQRNETLFRAGFSSLGCPHSLEEADPYGCPFCADRAAYREWQKREQAAQQKARTRRLRDGVAPQIGRRS